MRGTVLVTGGAGFIGSHATSRFLAEGLDVVVLDPMSRHLPSLDPLDAKARQYRLDTLIRGARVIATSTTHAQATSEAVRDARPRWVVHLGGIALPTRAQVESERAFTSILRGTFNLLEAVRQTRTVEKFVYVSSSMVYGDFARTPLPETSATAPKEVYGGLKLSSEILVQTFSRMTSVPHLIIRPSAVYGPTDLNRRIVQRLVEAACLQRPVTLRDPATTQLDFTYVSDVADGLTCALLSNVKNETINMTAGQGRTLQEVHELLRVRFPKMPVDVVTGQADFRPRRGALDISKARALLGYTPRFTLETGLDAYVDFVLELSGGQHALAAS